MTHLVNIRCRPLSLSISREACGAQVTRPYAPAVCRSCEVGAAHARGETATTWADGSAVEEVVMVPPVPSAKPLPKPPAVPRYAPAVHRLSTAPPNPTGRNGRRLERYAYRGQMLNSRELAALPEAVVDLETIRRRLRNPKRWDAERAIATRDGRRGA